VKKDYQYHAVFSRPIETVNLGLKNAGNELPTGWEQDPSLLEELAVIELNQTIPFDFQVTLGNSNKIDSLVFRIVAQNDFPAKINLQLYFADASHKVIDSLITNNNQYIITPATISDSGTVLVKGLTQPQYLDISVSHNRINNLENINYIIIAGLIQNNVPNNEFYKYYNTFSLYFEIGVRVYFDFNPMHSF
jgi:hypothetical protein